MLWSFFWCLQMFVFIIMIVSGWRSSKHRWWSSWDFEMGIHCLAWDYYCMDINPLRVSSRRHRGRKWHWSHVLDQQRSFISVWNMTQFAGSFKCMENADGVYQRNLASNCWKRCRTCKRCNVCNEGQAGKSNKHRPFSYKIVTTLPMLWKLKCSSIARIYLWELL